MPQEVGEVPEERERGRPWDAAAALGWWVGGGVCRGCCCAVRRVLGGGPEDWVVWMRLVEAERAVQGALELVKRALAARLHASEEAFALAGFEAPRSVDPGNGAEKGRRSVQACDARRA